MVSLGAVAAGDAVTASAAEEILRSDGNAFDAALAALFTACVSEPVLCSLAGGGFLLARPSWQEPLLYDFYGQTPGRVPDVDALDFLPVEVDFGTARQDFHIGRGAVAVPGMLAGACAAHKDLGCLPLAEVVAPAVRHARAGVPMAALQSFILSAVAPIFLWTEDSRALFGSRERPGETLQTGELLRLPRLADLLQEVAAFGPQALYSGPLAFVLVADQQRHGGGLRPQDLAGYEVVRRPALGFDFAGQTVLTNPPPSSGGALIAFAMRLLDGLPAGGSAQADLARIMAATGLARERTGLLGEATMERVEHLLSDEALASYRGMLAGRALKTGGTTHISVIDRAGNAAALSLSNGEGAGHLWPGTEIMLNNMLGEEDTNPQGFFRWRPDSRVSSMMAPSLVQRDDGGLVVLGSGGSNRIRSAILQVLVNLLRHGMTLRDAVSAPRLHAESGLLNLEPGLDSGLAGTLSRDFTRIEQWPEHNFFFGGVHAVAFDPASGHFEAAGDPRRGGVGLVVDG